MLALFHDKKCCNCINLFPCILWDLFVKSLVLSWWRLLKTEKIAQDSKVCDLLTTDSWVDNLWKVTWEAHTRSWRVKCQTIFASHFATWLTPRVTCETLYLDDFKCDSYTLHSYYIYPHYPQNCKEAIFKNALKMFLISQECIDPLW